MKRTLERIAALNHDQALAAALVPFFLVFAVCAVVFQATSGEAPGAPATIIDRFSSGLLWIGSIVALLIAVERRRDARSLVLWLIVSASAGGLAIDEVVELHERTMQVVGEDDYSKIVMWVGAAIAVAVILRFERGPRYFALALVTGLALQTAYLLTDLGDGDFFQMPFNEDIGDWVEEILEIFALEAYVTALLFKYTSMRETADPSVIARV